MGTPGSAFEVRCPRCDVSFAPETRRCIHCGGPTGDHAQSAIFESIAASDEAAEEWSSEPIDVMADPLERGEETGEEQTSVGRSLLRSLGGFFWIIVLIGFTLARSCGED